MNITEAREIKWAAGGFIGGFLLCYLLLGAFQFQPAASPPFAKATPITTWLPVPASPVVGVTNSQSPELIIELPQQWVPPPPGLLPGAPRPGYSLDLIDTHYQLPQPPTQP
jgi:hypothetical protein